ARPGIGGALASLAGPDQRRAAVIVVIFHLAIEALETFGHDDPATGFNGLDRAGTLAQMAAAGAAFGAALQESEQMQPVAQGEDAAERAEEAAKEALGEQAHDQQHQSIGDIGPGAGEGGS